ncbi:MAG: hypothetical protein R2695_04305 [Acidimicrobiales bacterium]
MGEDRDPIPGPEVGRRAESGTGMVSSWVTGAPSPLVRSAARGRGRRPGSRRADRAARWHPEATEVGECHVGELGCEEQRGEPEVGGIERLAGGDVASGTTYCVVAATGGWFDTAKRRRPPL